MKQLSLKEIENLLLKVLQVSEKNNIFIWAIFDTLFRTGLRVNEVIQTWRWSVQTDLTTLLSRPLLIFSIFAQSSFNSLLSFDALDKYIVQTEKGNNFREFTKDELNPIFADIIKYDAGHLLPHSYKKVAYLFNRFSPYQKIYVGNKEVSTHLFRHYIAKKMKADGYTDKEIADYLGEKDVKNAQNYINSVVYVL